jgi:predicted aspartyl protease
VKVAGVVRNGAPLISGRVQGGVLHLGVGGSEELIVDTGFNGALAVPHALARQIALEYAGVGNFTLATGKSAELPIYTGTVRIGRKRCETWFILGDGLVGMEFLAETSSQLLLDLENGALEIQLR